MRPFGIENTTVSDDLDSELDDAADMDDSVKDPIYVYSGDEDSSSGNEHNQSGGGKRHKKKSQTKPPPKRLARVSGELNVIPEQRSSASSSESDTLSQKLSKIEQGINICVQKF